MGQQKGFVQRMEQRSGRKREFGKNNSKSWDALPGVCPGGELQGDPSKEQTERGRGSAGKEEHKSLRKNLWNDLEKILRPQKVGNVPSAGTRD